MGGGGTWSTKGSMPRSDPPSTDAHSTSRIAAASRRPLRPLRPTTAQSNVSPASDAAATSCSARTVGGSARGEAMHRLRSTPTTAAASW